MLTLKENGFDNAAALLGGFAAWQSAGLKVEQGPPPAPPTPKP